MEGQVSSLLPKDEEWKESRFFETWQRFRSDLPTVTVALSDVRNVVSTKARAPTSDAVVLDQINLTFRFEIAHSPPAKAVTFGCVRALGKRCRCYPVVSFKQSACA